MATILPELICTVNKRTGATDLSKAALRTISLNRVYELISLTVILASILYGLGRLLEWGKWLWTFLRRGSEHPGAISTDLINDQRCYPTIKYGTSSLFGSLPTSSSAFFPCLNIWNVGIWKPIGFPGHWQRVGGKANVRIEPPATRRSLSVHQYWPCKIQHW